MVDLINVGFAIIFTLEAVLKIFGYGRDYFRDGWNVFDFLLVIGTMVGFFLLGSSGSKTSLIRIFRIGRILKLVKRAKSIRAIFNTFVTTLPSLANVGALLLLFLYMYAILGMYLLGHVKLQSAASKNANFQTFPMALLTLFRVSTGDNWELLMNDYARPYSLDFHCQQDPSYDDYAANGFTTQGCGTAFSYFYFVTFMLIVTLIFLNLFVAIILEGFESTSEIEEQRVSEANVEGFLDAWQILVPNGGKYLKLKKLDRFIELLALAENPLIPHAQFLQKF